MTSIPKTTLLLLPITLVAIFSLYGFINDYPLKVVSDIPYHLASLRELSDFSKMPGSPYFVEGVPDLHYGPYFVSIAFLSNVVKNSMDYGSELLMLQIVGLFVISFVLLSIYIFTKNYISEEAGLVSAIITPFILGTPFIVWSGDISFHGAMYNSFFPQTFAIGGVFLTLWALHSMFKYQTLTSIIVLFIFFYITFVSHILTGLLLYALSMLFIIQEYLKNRINLKFAIFAFIILQVSIISTYLWPYFSVFDLLNKSGFDIIKLLLLSIAGFVSIIVLKMQFERYNLNIILINKLITEKLIFVIMFFSASIVVYTLYEIEMIIYLLFVMFLFFIQQNKIKFDASRILVLGLFISLILFLVFLMEYRINSFNVFYLDLNTLKEWRWFLVFSFTGVLGGLNSVFKRTEILLSLWGLSGIFIYILSTKNIIGMEQLPWRFLLFSVPPLAILTGRAVIESRQKKLFVIALALLLIAGFVWKIDQLDSNKYSQINENVSYVYEISKFLPYDGKVVLSDPYTSWYVAGLTGHKILNVIPNLVDSREYDRNIEGYRLVYNFYNLAYLPSSQSNDALKKELKKFNVTYILINKKIIPKSNDSWNFSAQVRDYYVKTNQERQRIEDLIKYNKKEYTLLYESKNFSLFKYDG